jgi:hypothetical protein
VAVAGRDGDLGGLIPMDAGYRDFVTALNQKSQRWVDASRGLSRRLVRERLAWSGQQVAAYHDTRAPWRWTGAPSK